MVKVADIGIFKDHLRAYRQISEAIDQGKIPIGLPLILVDEHSDNRNSTAEEPHDGNWLTFLKEEGKISDAFWVWPEGRKHEIRYEVGCTPEVGQGEVKEKEE